MTLQKFIERAIEGGWDSAVLHNGFKPSELVEEVLHGVLLDPEAWEAVGKVSNWGTEMVMIDELGHPKEWHYFDHCPVCGETINDEEEGCPEGCETQNAPVPEWLYNMHRMIDALAEGKSLEDFIATL